MTLHAPSAHFVADHSSLVNHGFQKVLYKTSGKISHSTCKLYFGNSIRGYEVIPHGVKTTHNRSKTRTLFISAKAKDESERSRSKLTAEEVLKETFVAIETNNSKKGSDIDVTALSPLSECELSYKPLDHELDQGSLLDKLKAVHLHVLAMEQWNASRLKNCNKNYFYSATNLIHYLALKYLDVEQLQEELSLYGLLNLDTTNPNVLASITAAIQMLDKKSHYLNTQGKQNLKIPNLEGSQDIVSSREHSRQRDAAEFTISTMRKRASSHKKTLLGPLRDEMTTHIMVTVGKEATESDTHLSDLLKAGATTIRINCAYGEPSVWSDIITRAKKSSQMLEKPCRILMDLAGPKLRTGVMEVGPAVMKISPKKDVTGKVTLPAQVWLSQPGSAPPPAHLCPDAVLHIENEELLDRLEAGNILRFYDARGKRRMLKITKKFPIFAGIGCIAECSRTSYVESGTKMTMKVKKGRPITGHIVDVPCTEHFVRLKVGDLLTISRDLSLTPEHGLIETTNDSPRITCCSSHLFDSVKPGERIAFDDGKIWGVIQGTSSSEIVISITHANPKGSKLGSGKSINIPDSEIRFEGLTSKDIMDLEFVASHADMVGVSFVRDVRDVVVLQKELEKRKLRKLGVVLKIETKSGFEKLPLLLLQAMRSPNPLGIMIARGDLAVECGWDRLAGIQEEILSMCLASHVPVIWATQVLESLVKSGLPSRAEITDVASGKRASCIMLNKGKYLMEAVTTLESMLQVNSRKINAELKPLVLSTNTS